MARDWVVAALAYPVGAALPSMEGHGGRSTSLEHRLDTALETHSRPRRSEVSVLQSMEGRSGHSTSSQHGLDTALATHPLPRTRTKIIIEFDGTVLNMRKGWLYEAAVGSGIPLHRIPRWLHPPPWQTEWERRNGPHSIGHRRPAPRPRQRDDRAPPRNRSRTPRRDAGGGSPSHRRRAPHSEDSE